MIPYCKHKAYTFFLLLFIMATTVFNVQAQTENKPEQKTALVQLSPDQWKAVEGVFQNQRNKDMYVQFIAKENFLQAKLLWNNNELKLFPENPLDFVSKEEVEGGLIHMNFKKDSTGAITQVLLNKDNLLTRAKDYKPVVRVEMQHTPAQLKKYEGIYRLQQRNQERFIQFTEKDNKLILKQHWDGTEISFTPETDSNFFSKELPLFSLLFIKGADGNIAQALVNKRDKWEKLNKTVASPEQLKAIAGKYEFKDDPDNTIQLSIKGNNIIVKQLWDKKEIVLEPQTPTYFYNAKESYPMQITTDATGAVTQVLVLGMDVFVKVKE